MIRVLVKSFHSREAGIIAEGLLYLSKRSGLKREVRFEFVIDATSLTNYPCKLYCTLIFLKKPFNKNKRHSRIPWQHQELINENPTMLTFFVHPQDDISLINQKDTRVSNNCKTRSIHSPPTLPLRIRKSSPTRKLGAPRRFNSHSSYTHTHTHR